MLEQPANDALIEKYVRLAATKGEAAVEQIAALRGSSYASARAAASSALRIFRDLPAAERDRLRGLAGEEQPARSGDDLSLETEERKFVPRPDGRWSYFPSSFGDSGYVVDDAARRRVLDDARRSRRLERRSALAVLVLLLVIGSELGQRYPAIGLYTAHSIMLWSVYLTVVAAMSAASSRRRRRRIADALSGAPPASPDPDRAGERAAPSLSERWQRSSGPTRLGAIVALALTLVGVARLPLAAAHDLRLPDTPSRVAGLLELAWFASFLALGGWALLRRLRTRRRSPAVP